jgi:hypothetical protein
MNKNVLSTILPLNYLKIPKNLARTWQDESVSVRAGAIKQNESDRSRTHSRSVLSCSVPASRDFVPLCETQQASRYAFTSFMLSE